MANKRPNQLPPATTITDNDRLILDQGAAGVNAAAPSSLLNTFAPVATQAEAEAGTDNIKRMTPLRAQQHLLAQGVPNTRSVVAGDGLEGGGNLAANRTLALSSTSIASLALADSAVQSVNGKTGSSVTLTKADVGLSNVDNTSDANKPISTATQTALNAKADSSITITAGAGLAGGGDLTANRTVALDAASIASLVKADEAVPQEYLDARLFDIKAFFPTPATGDRYVYILAESGGSWVPAAYRATIGNSTGAIGVGQSELVERGTSGRVRTPAPNADNDAVNLAYLNTELSAKVTKSGDTGLGGFTSAGHNLGNLSGTVRPAPTATSNFKYGANVGAFTLAAPTTAGYYTIAILVTNAASGAGAMTATGFSKVHGTFAADDNKKQVLTIEVFGSDKVLTIRDAS